MRFSRYTSIYRNNSTYELYNVRNGKMYILSQQEFNSVSNSISRQELEESNLIFDLIEAQLIVYEEQYPEKIQVMYEMTKKCNLKCKHCALSSDNTYIDISDDMYKIYAGKIAELKPDSLVLTGGEPLLIPNFKEIVDYLYSQNIRMTLMTNSTLINKSMAEYIRDRFVGVDISIDGVDERTTSEIRGAGVFDKVINSIKTLQEVGMDRIALSMVMTADNVKHEEDFDVLCEKLSVLPVKRALSYRGRAKDNYTKNISSRDSSISNDRRIICDGAYSKLYFSCNGDIYPCQMFSEQEYSMGNIFEIDNIFEYIHKRHYTKTDGYKRFYSCFPHVNDHCSLCRKRLNCFSCLAELKERNFCEKGE